MTLVLCHKCPREASEGDPACPECGVLDREGPFEQYYESGQLMARGTYLCGVLHGSYEEYNESGQLEGKYNFEKGIEQVKIWATKVRQDGYLSLEDQAMYEKDYFISKGLNLLIDGSEQEQFFDTMDNEIRQQRNALNESSNVYNAMGGYSPTIGILGAVLGLIQAMNFIKQPEMLGAGIATAFIATIYGVGFANLLYIPIANKLNNLIDEYSRYHQMLAEVSRAPTNSPRSA